MFLLDTNILSAVMGTRPDPQVASWMAEQPPDLLFTAAVPQAEILSVITVLPKGRRQEALEMAALAMFRADFAGRILPFDTDAAVIYAELFALRRSAGRPAATADLMIASIARACGGGLKIKNLINEAAGKAAALRRCPSRARKRRR
jgi:predicted nucleic acid-binding protein